MRIGDAATGKQKEELIQVLAQLSNAFALSDDELGETSVVEHSIDTKGAPPVLTSPRQIPYSLRTELEKELESLQRIGCIEKQELMSRRRRRRSMKLTQPAGCHHNPN